MSEPRLAFLIPSFAGGGAEPMIIRLANEFARRGRPVDLVVFRPEGENAGKVSAAVRLVDLRVRSTLLAPFAIRSYLRRERPAVLISALFFANAFAILARALAPGCGTRLIVTERAVLSVHARYSRRASRHLFVPVARLLYRFADRVVGISAGVAQDLRAITGLSDEQLLWIHNPALSPEVEEAARRKPGSLPWPDDGLPVIVTAGRLEPQKDQATLLRAFARLRARRPARLVIFGQGSLRPELEALVRELGLEDDALLPGYEPDLLPVLAAADLFVLSSLYEGFGNVLVEALACGLPVVSTDCPSGPSEILGDGEFGRLVPPGDEAALAEALEAALDDPGEPERHRSRAREFSLERCADRFEALVDQLS